VAVASEQVKNALEDVGDLLSQATFRPHIEDGQPAGISITGIKPNAIFRKLRLRNGDVITGVNNQPITTVDDAMKVFGTLSPDGPIQVQIKRRGREETLEYKID
jgi:general secretion pathway protein C